MGKILYYQIRSYNKYIRTALLLRLCSVISMQGLGEGSGEEFSLGKQWRNAEGGSWALVFNVAG